jgi:predicted alpha-1,2-mannosidase
VTEASVHFVAIAAVTASVITALLTPHLDQDRDLARYVDPFIGTTADGNTFPGPVAPFGMVQWGPDTLPDGARSGGGYDYRDTQIGGFGLTRLSGAGCAAPADVPFLPTTKAISGSPVAPGAVTFDSELLPSFTHDQEQAEPGFYRVSLDPGTPRQIDAELTATTRTGAGRFAYPAGSPAGLLINGTATRSALKAPASFEDLFFPKQGNRAGQVRIDPARRQVSGSSTSARTCAISPTGYRLHWVAEFSLPFQTFATWTRQQLAPGSTSAQDTLDDAGAAQTGAYLTFDTTTSREVAVRVGISYVSVENARRNLRAEAGRHRGFDSIRNATAHDWNRLLSRIAVEGGSHANRTMFYSMLYKALIHPSTFSDVDGRYRGMDFQVHKAGGYTQYANFSGWDVYRSQLPLLGLLVPEVASDVVTSLLADYRQSGWLPKWSMANVQTGVMAGDPADPAIASIWALGGRDFDVAEALSAMVKGATRSGTSPNGDYVEREGTHAYQRLGYVPHELAGSPLTVFSNDRTKVWGSASTTLEYATADFAIAMLAAGAGDTRTCRTFLRRGGWWRNLVDPATRLVSPRSASGEFVSAEPPPGADPLTAPVAFVQGDARTYTFQVPQDPAGLAEALGGRDQTVARLDAYFGPLGTGPPSETAPWLVNQPASNSPWLYDWLGRPAKTQQVVRQAITEVLRPAPDGLPGNDDLGHLASWYVFGALGFNPTVPGTDILALGSPLFPKTTIRLPGGELRIVAPAAAPEAPYVHGLRVNGEQWGRPWLRLADVARGGVLRFELSAVADPAWGSAATAAPPSFGPDDTSVCATSSQPN